jgi:uncharacterized membrane protein YdbT with pleckstrin-like domain
LLTQIQSALPVRRVQALRVVSPVLQRRLGYCHVYADSAASFTDKAAGGAAQLTPLIEEANTGSILDLVFPRLDVWQVEWRKVSPLTKRRGFFRYLLVGLVLLGAVEAGIGRVAFAAIPVVVAIAWYAAWKRYMILGYARRDGFLFARSGVWTRTITALPENRIQWTDLAQGPIQRRFGLCNLHVMSAASGRSGSLTVVDLPIEIGRELQSVLGAKSDVEDPVLAGGL